MYFYFQSTWLKGSLKYYSCVTFCPPAAQWRKDVEEKVFPFKLAVTALFSQSEEKALAWWNAAREPDNKVCCAFSYSNPCFLKKRRLKKKKKKKKRIEDFRKSEHRKGRWKSATFLFKNMTQTVGFLPFTLSYFSTSPKSDIWNTVPLKYNKARRALMVWNVPKCSYAAGDIGDPSGKSPKSGQFCTGGKWTTLAQTDLISVWFTTCKAT